jgi:YVTN family beta-propeller protein/probable HAF family extracellular repeat protein
MGDGLAKCRVFILPLLLAAVMLAASSASAQQFVTVNVPGATATVVQGINNSGQMVGVYVDTQGVDHGFSLTGGVFTTIDFAGATLTSATAINNVGQIAGYYTDRVGETHGFVLTNGSFASITDPDFSCSTCGTFIFSITDTGVIVGSALDVTGVFHGFQDVNGTFTTFDVAGSSFTELLGVPFLNGDIVGLYSTSPGVFQGAVYNNGLFTTFNVSGASSTELNGINDGGEVVGTYLLSGVNHAFSTTCTNQSGSVVCSPTVTTIDFPGALATSPASLNDGGQVVGEYLDSSSVAHGFVMTSGPFAYVVNFGSNNVSVIDVPSSLTVATIPVGAGPYGAAISPDGTQVYVSNANGDSVSVIATASNTVSATIQVQSSPTNVAFTPDGSEAFVANSGSSSVSVIDTASQTVVATVPVGSLPYAVAMVVTSNGTFAYVTSAVANNVSVISVASNMVIQTINVGSYPVGAAAAPNSSLVYVVNQSSNNISVISVATNTVIATIPIGIFPIYAAFTPDSSTVYVTNYDSATVSVIDTASSTVIATVAGFTHPFQVALTTDGAYAYVTDTSADKAFVVTTATNTITQSIPVGTIPNGIAIASVPPSTLIITQPLSPTQPNVFNFGTNNQTVTYPPGTNFTGVNMTTAAVEITQAQFAQRVAGTQFAGATCIVYSGSGGNCVDYQVTCSDTNGNPITCPGETEATITVQTGFSTSQAIINPGYLTTPIGENLWENIFTGFTDATVIGKTKGFSEFVAVDLGADNAQGEAKYQILSPTLPTTFCSPQIIPLEIHLTSVANGTAITDAQAGVSVMRLEDEHGNPDQQILLAAPNVFVQTLPGRYKYDVQSPNYPPGTYALTIFGNAFPAFQGRFKIHVGCQQREPRAAGATLWDRLGSD